MQYLFITTLIGLGLGPTSVALVTDYVFADDQALRYSLLLITALAVGSAAVLLGAGLKPYRASLEYLQNWQPKTQSNAAKIDLAS